MVESSDKYTEANTSSTSQATTTTPATPTSVRKSYRMEQQKRREEARKQLRIEQQKKFAAATANVLSSPPSPTKKKIDFTGRVVTSSKTKTNNSNNNDMSEGSEVEVPTPTTTTTPPLKSCIEKKEMKFDCSDSDRTTEPTTKMMHEDDTSDGDVEAQVQAQAQQNGTTTTSSSSPQEQEQPKEGTVTNVTDLTQYVGDTFEQQLESFIQAHPVVMFNRTWCLFSIDAQAFLTQQMKVNVHAIEVDIHPQGKAIMAFIEDKTRHTTVPAIFIKGEFLGGFDHVNSLYASGKLQNQYLKGISQADQCEEFIKKSGITTIQPLFWFPATVNGHVVRGTGIITCLLAALSAATTYWFIWGKYIGYGIFFDFVLRLFGGSRFSVVGQIATFLTNHVFNLEPKPRHGRPKQFATMCGIMFSGLGSLMFVIPQPVYTDYIGIAFMGGLAGACGMEGFLDFCVGCFIFKYGIKLGLIRK